MMNFKGIIYSLKEPFTKKPRVCVGGGVQESGQTRKKRKRGLLNRLEVRD